MAEAETIRYSDHQLASYDHHHSRLKPIQPGDLCCNCGGDCDGDGFGWLNFVAVRVNGHPLCSRPKCLDAQMAEFTGHRGPCRCGLGKK
jgi:hypothetical protein